MTFAEIESKLDELCQICDSCEGAYEQLNDTIEFLNCEKKDKINGISAYIKKLEAYCIGIKAIEEDYSNRRKGYEKRIGHLKDFLSKALDGVNFESEVAKISFRKSKAVDIVDFLEIPEKYIRYLEPQPDKKEILKALKAGAVIPGAKLIEKNNMIFK